MASLNPGENPLISGKNKNRPGLLPQKVHWRVIFFCSVASRASRTREALDRVQPVRAVPMSASEWETPNEKVSFLRLFLDKQKESKKKKRVIKIACPTLGHTSIIPNTIPYRPILPMDDHIGLVFPGQAFCFVDGRILEAVFGGDPLVPLTPYGPPSS